MEQISAERRLGRPRDQDSAETLDRILVAARRLFASEGYGATTNREIARAAGLTPSALYHYFSSKAELYAAVFEQVSQSMDRALNGVWCRPGLAERIDLALDVTLGQGDDDPSVYGYLAGVATEVRRHPELAVFVDPELKRHRAFLHQVVADAVRSGELDSGVAPRAAEDALDALLVGVSSLAAHMRDPRRRTQLVRAAQLMVEGNLTRRAAAPRTAAGR